MENLFLTMVSKLRYKIIDYNKKIFPKDSFDLVISYILLIIIMISIFI